MQLGTNISVTEYWERVHSLAADLPAVVTLISIQDDRTGAVGGVICHAVNTERDRTAAKLIFAGSHRIATEPEIADHEKAEATERARLAEVEYRRKAQFTLPTELNNLIEVAVRAGRVKDKKKPSKTDQAELDQEQESEQG